MTRGYGLRMIGVRDEGLRITGYTGSRGLGTKGEGWERGARGQGPGVRYEGLGRVGLGHQDHATPIAQRSFVD